MKIDRILITLIVVVLALAAVVAGVRWSRRRAQPAEPTTREGAVALVVVGVPGLDAPTIERLSADGRLPNIARLRAEGAAVVFANPEKDAEPEIVWTILATGVARERLGMDRPQAPLPKGGPLPPSGPPAPRLWSAISEKGSTVAVLGWPATWPVADVNGVMVSPYATYVLERSHGGDPAKRLSPPSEYDALDRLIEEPDVVTRADLAGFVVGDSRLGLEALIGVGYEALKQAAAGDRSMVNLSRRVAVDPGADGVFVFLAGLDNVTQRFWHYAHPDEIRWDALAPDTAELVRRQAEALGEVVDRYYESLDGMIGGLASMVEDGGTFAVVASHGYSGLAYDERGNPKIGANMYSPRGLLLMAGPRITPGARAEIGTPTDVAPTIAAAAGIALPSGVDGKVCTEVLNTR